MRTVLLQTPARREEWGESLARRTRHLHARLLDFGPGGPEVIEVDQERGLIRVRVPGHSMEQVARQLELQGIQMECQGEEGRFWLSTLVAFEDLDYLWGCLFGVLGD